MRQIGKQLAGILILGCLSTGLLAQYSRLLAQEQTPLQDYAKGFVPTPTEEYLNFPREAKYRAYLPPSIDLSRSFPTPGHQGGIGSCVGWAVGYAARGYYSHALEGNKRNAPNHIPSPGYIYGAIKRLGDCDTGSRISDALNLLKRGALSLKEYPYLHTACPTPSATDIEKAIGFRIKDWYTINFRDPDDIKGQLAKKRPVIFGMSVSDGLHELNGSQIYKDDSQVPQSGRHAMVVVGYDDKRGAFKVINSWGTDWGDNGFGWIDYNTFTAKTDEAYSMYVEFVSPPPFPSPQPPKPADVTGLECAKVLVSEGPGRRNVTGFVSSTEDLARVRAAYSTADYDVDLEVRPWPQCEVLLTLEDQLGAEGRPTIELKNGSNVLQSGETLSFSVAAPSLPTYIYVSYVAADGSVSTLSQPDTFLPQPFAPKSTQVFGDGKDGRAQFIIGAPYGREMIVVLAARSPLFDEPLPPTMTERDYLTAVRRALIYRPDAQMPLRFVSASFLPLITKE